MVYRSTPDHHSHDDSSRRARPHREGDRSARYERAPQDEYNFSESQNEHPRPLSPRERAEAREAAEHPRRQRTQRSPRTSSRSSATRTSGRPSRTEGRPARSGDRAQRTSSLDSFGHETRRTRPSLPETSSAERFNARLQQARGATRNQVEFSYDDGGERTRSNDASTRRYEQARSRDAERSRTTSSRSSRAYASSDGYDDVEDDRYAPRHSSRADRAYDDTPRLPFGGLSGEQDVYVGGGGRGRGGLFGAVGSLPWPVAVAVPVVGLILIIVLMVTIVGAVQSCTSQPAEQGEDAQTVTPMTINYTPSIAAFDGLTDPGTNVSGFTLVTEGDSWTPSLDDTNSAAITSALNTLTKNGTIPVGFVFTDLQSGAGYAYNIDAKVYGASSFKGPVFIYGCQQAIEPGNISMNSVNSNCEGAIVWSDNKSYYRMRNSFEGSANETLGAWLSSMNISETLANDTSFPHYAARDSVKLWMNTYLYFNAADSDPDVVSWAQDFFGRTDTSMLRDGVTMKSAAADTTSGDSSSSSDGSSDSSGSDSSSSDSGSSNDASASDASGSSSDNSSSDSSSSDSSSSSDANSSDATAQSTSNITVYDKAGWINGTEDDGLCDAGIIIEGNHAYLLSIMTGDADSDTNRANFSALVNALWNARSTLVPPQGMVAGSTSDAGQQSDGGQQNA